jgi:hypothetical protein
LGGDVIAHERIGAFVVRIRGQLEDRALFFKQDFEAAEDFVHGQHPVGDVFLFADVGGFGNLPGAQQAHSRTVDAEWNLATSFFLKTYVSAEK